MTNQQHMSRLALNEKLKALHQHIEHLNRHIDDIRTIHAVTNHMHHHRRLRVATIAAAVGIIIGIVIGSAIYLS